MTWTMVGMIAALALIGIVVMVVIYAVIETQRNNEHKRRLSLERKEKTAMQKYMGQQVRNDS